MVAVGNPLLTNPIRHDNLSGGDGVRLNCDMLMTPDFGFKPEQESFFVKTWKSTWKENK
jgi:hypothetical protein